MLENMHLLYPAKGRQKCAQPNYEYFDIKRRSIRNYRIQYLYDEYRQACERAGEPPYSLSTFSAGFSEWRRKNIKKQVPAWFPGEYLQCYWTRLDVGKSSPCPKMRSFFIARLPYSEYTYARAVDNVSYQNWMQMCIEAYHFFGGVPHVTEYDRIFNEIRFLDLDRPRSAYTTLQAFAAHYKTVLFHPCPKTMDSASKHLKPLVPKRQSKLARYIVANLNVSGNASVEEINEQVVALVDRFNGMSIKGEPSAKETFELYEAPQLLALPTEDYDMSVWAERLIGADYHFVHEKMKYSVPYTYAHELVRIRIAEDFIEVYSMGSLIARHAIPDKKEGRSLCTNPSHRPPKHGSFADRLVNRFMGLALEIGPATGAIMKETLAICEKEGVYRRCKDLLDLRRMPSGVSLEEACVLVLDREMALSVESVRQIMQENTR